MTTPTAATQRPPRHVSQLATTHDVARFLNLDPYTVRAYARDGIIPAYRVGRTFRFDMATVAAWLEARALHPSNASTEQPQLQLVDDVDEPVAKGRTKAAR